MFSGDFLRTNYLWLLAGFLLAFSSSFGQTFYISIFAGHIRAEFDLSHGAFGGIYAIGTLASAATLVFLGKLADRDPLRPVAALTLAGLACVTLGMALVANAVMLLIVIYGLRLLGQGMISHLSMTAMGKWFDRERGRSVSIAALGYGVGEAVLPLIAVGLIVWIGWRNSWFVVAATLLLVLLPGVWWCLRQEPHRTHEPKAPEAVPLPVPSHTAPVTTTREPPSATSEPILRRQGKRGWTRAEVLKDPLFHVLIPCVKAPTFIITGIFFNQVHLVETKGWTLGMMASGFTLFAIIQTIMTLLVGMAIDRYTAVRLLPVYLLPMAASLMVIAWVDALWGLFAMMALLGLTTSADRTMHGAIWAELYGMRHLGGIRALITALMVVFSAASPGLMGLMIDAGISLETQAIGMAIYTVLASVVMLLLQPRLRVASST